MHQVAVGATVQAARQDEGGVRPDRVLDFDVVPVDARRQVAGRVRHKAEREGLGRLRNQIRIPTLDEVVLPGRAAEIRTVLSRSDSSPRTLRSRRLGWRYD